jgi:TonB family protein
MNVVLRVALLVITGGFVASAATTGSAQNIQGSEGEATLITLSKVSYPSLARQTRVAGNVELAISVKADGAVQSIDIVSGHPLLTRAALDSAQQSKFECRKCGEAGTSFHLVYTFQLAGPDKCCTNTKGDADEVAPEQQVPRLVQSQNHVTVIDRPPCFCDLAGQIGKVRSLKCLYLWRCSLH